MDVGADHRGGERAIRAWRAHAGGGARPSKVELVGGLHTGRTTYRLVEAGPGGSSVIAKHSPTASAATERLCYERILPEVPVTSPHFYGSIEEDGFTWLFLEDVGQQRIDPGDPQHVALATWWLGLLHVHAVDVVAASSLPNRGARSYIDHLRSGRRNILENLGNPTFHALEVAMLESVLRLLDAIEADWRPLEVFCAQIPNTLVHGDFQPKNLYVRRDGGETRLYPIDWETAGWAVAAADLAPSPGQGAGVEIDLHLYRSIVSGRFPPLDEPTLRVLKRLGKLFRLLAAVDWASHTLQFASPQKQIQSIGLYRTELEEAAAANPWARRLPAGGSRP